MAMQYKRYLTIAVVAVVLMYIVANHAKDVAGKVGLNYVGTPSE